MTIVFGGGGGVVFSGILRTRTRSAIRIRQCIRIESSDRRSHDIFNITLCVSVHNVGKRNTRDQISSPKMQQIILILFVSFIATSCKITYQFQI